MRLLAKIVGYAVSGVYVLWMLQAIQLSVEEHHEFNLVTHVHMGITLLIIVFLLFPYNKMRFLVPIGASLSGVFYLIVCILIGRFDAWFMIAISFSYAIFIFFMFYLGRDKSNGT